MGPFSVSAGCGCPLRTIAGDGLCTADSRAGWVAAGAGAAVVSLAGGIVRCCAAGAVLGACLCASAFGGGELEWNSHTSITINAMEATAYTQKGSPERSGLCGYSVFGGSWRTTCGMGCSCALATGFD